MNVEHLVEMANQIGDFFKVNADHAAAVDGVANHMAKFWEKRMRSAIIAHEKSGGAGLHDLTREAVRALKG